MTCSSGQENESDGAEAASPVHNNISSSGRRSSPFRQQETSNDDDDGFLRLNGCCCRSVPPAAVGHPVQEESQGDGQAEDTHAEEEQRRKEGPDNVDGHHRGEQEGDEDTGEGCR